MHLKNAQRSVHPVTASQRAHSLRSGCSARTNCADPVPLRLAPQACGVAGQAGWMHTAKWAFFVALGFFRFVSESRPASRRYPYRVLRERGPLGASSRFAWR
jgi:hypothetical protein